MKVIQVPSLLKDIRFWIVLFFVVRLIGITNAPLETGHNWRQCFTNMVTRNMVEQGPDVRYPKADILGNSSGVIASEFPIFNYLNYWVAKFFGFQHWYGRLINLVISTLGLWYFYKTVRSLFDSKTAFNATFILTTSIWFAFSRKIMPDTFSMSLLFMGMYGGVLYIKENKLSGLFAYFILCSLGMLAKIPAIAVFSVSGLVVFVKDIPRQRRFVFALTTGLCVLLVFAWYFAWVPYLVKTYGYSLYDSKGFAEGIQEILPHLGDLAEKFYFSATHSYVATLCFVFGIYFFLKQQRSLYRYALLLVTVMLLFFILKTGAIFPTHNYYIIPFVPVIALLAGYAVSKVPNKFQALLLLIIGIEGVANQQHDFFIKPSEQYRLELEHTVDQYIPKNDLVLINGGISPQEMYYANRKGWSVENSSIKSSTYLDSLSALGAKFLILNKHKGLMELTSKQEVFKDAHYVIYSLEQPALN